jgi:CheY-like chemotaxis protein
MVANGPILIVEDDSDDVFLLKEVFKRLQVSNEIKFFYDGESFLNYLKTTKDLPFIIIVDINLPKINGIELKEKINEDDFLRKKSIPFIYLSTTHYPFAINKAYEMIVQGFFTKENDFNAAVAMMKIILDYWRICKHPRL